jgi:glycosyltransferase involved in cell wall biosynthesis
MNGSDSIVIIPTYNEKENIEKIVRAVFSLEKAFDILVIDDGSPDGTAGIVKGLMAAEFAGRLHILERSGKLGLGTAYIMGFKWALDHEYDYVFEMDADFSHDPSDLPRLYSACHDEGYDVAVGSRYVSGVNVVNWPMGRVLMSYYASKYVRMITGIKVRDTTAGFVCYKRQVLATIELDKIRFKGYAFQIEMKYTAYKIGFKIKEVPVIFVNRREGTSKMSGGIFSEAFFGVMRLRWDGWWRKYPAIKAASAALAMMLTMGTTAQAQTEPTVTTNTKFARGATMAFGRMTAKANGSTIKEQGFCWASHPQPTVDENTTTSYLSNNGRIYWLKELQPATLYYMRAYAKAQDGSVGYGEDIKFYTLPKGEVTCWYNNGGDAAANTRITNAKDEACQIFSDLTSIKKHFNMGYSPGTPTADCGYSDEPWINMGSNSSYQRTGTIMHEMEHGLGLVPYSTQWNKNILRAGLDGEGRGTGQWLGDRVSEFLDFWDNTSGSRLNGDYQHMWPYGINGAHEDNGSKELYFANALIGQALGEDGLEHRSNTFAEPCYVFNQEDDVKYYIKNEDVERGLYTSYLMPNATGRLLWKQLSSEQAAQNDSAAWYVTFTPQNQYYQFRNAATGQYITYSGGIKTMQRESLTDADNFHLMRGRIDVGKGEGAQRGYWIIHPSGNLSPYCLAANASEATGAKKFDISNSATQQRWLIMTAEEAKLFDAAALTQLRDEAKSVLVPVKALMNVPHTTTDPQADQAFSATIADLEARIEHATSPAELVTLGDEAAAAALQFLNVATPTDMEHPFDLTYMVHNPGIDSAEGWSVAPTISYSCGEFYQTTFDFYQTVKKLPKGTFMLKVQAFQRPGSWSDAYNDYAGGNNKVNATVYAGGKSELMAHIASEAQSRKLGGTEKTVGGNKYIPDNMQAASLYFAAGLYENTVVYTSNLGQLKIGVKSTSMPSSYWCIFDNFRLYFYGGVDSDYITGVNDVVVTQQSVEENAVYSLDGRRQTKGIEALKPGLYIKGGKKYIVR